MRLEGKVAVVTGGASGIGKAAALLLAKEGAHIAILDADEKNGAKVAREIRKNGQCIFIRCDVSSSKDVEKAAAAVAKKFRKTSILFNNAGVYMGDGILHKMPEKAWDKTTSTNLKSVYLCSKYFMPLMKSGGAIINTASALGLVAEPESPAYCASKAAVIHLTKVMALQYAGAGIRVNCVCPGPIDTPMTRRSLGRELKSYASRHTILKRLGRPEEVASTVLFLASDEASFMTGAAVSVDGGESVIL